MPERAEAPPPPVPAVELSDSGGRTGGLGFTSSMGLASAGKYIMVIARWAADVEGAAFSARACGSRSSRTTAPRITGCNAAGLPDTLRSSRAARLRLGRDDVLPRALSSSHPATSRISSARLS